MLSTRSVTMTKGTLYNVQTGWREDDHMKVLPPHIIFYKHGLWFTDVVVYSVYDTYATRCYIVLFIWQGQNNPFSHDVWWKAHEAFQPRRTRPKPPQREAFGNICVILRFQPGFGCVAEQKRYNDRFFKSKSVLWGRRRTRGGLNPCLKGRVTVTRDTASASGLERSDLVVSRSWTTNAAL